MISSSNQTEATENNADNERTNSAKSEQSKEYTRFISDTIMIAYHKFIVHILI